MQGKPFTHLGLVIALLELPKLGCWIPDGSKQMQDILSLVSGHMDFCNIDLIARNSPKVLHS